MNPSRPMWEVVNTSDTTAYTPGQAPVPAKKVDFQLVDGSIHSVVVPVSQYIPENVEALIERAAATEYQIKGLKSRDIFYPQGIPGEVMPFPTPGT